MFIFVSVNSQIASFSAEKYCLFFNFLYSLFLNMSRQMIKPNLKEEYYAIKIKTFFVFTYKYDEKTNQLFKIASHKAAISYHEKLSKKYGKVSYQLNSVKICNINEK